MQYHHQQNENYVSEGTSPEPAHDVGKPKKPRILKYAGIVTYAGIELNLDKSTATYNGHKHHLQRIGLNIFATLMENPDYTFSAEELYFLAGGTIDSSSYNPSSTISTHIHRTCSILGNKELIQRHGWPRRFSIAPFVLNPRTNQPFENPTLG